MTVFSHKDAGGPLQHGDIEVSWLISPNTGGVTWIKHTNTAINLHHLYIAMASGVQWTAVHRVSLAQVQDHTGRRGRTLPSCRKSYRQTAEDPLALQGGQTEDSQGH